MSLFSWAAPLALGYRAYKPGKKVGDARIPPRPELVGQAQIYYYPGDQHALLTCRIPMKNAGRQQALIIDANAVLQPVGDCYSDLQPVCRLVNLDCPRAMGDREGYIISAGKESVLEIRLHVTSTEGIAKKLAEMAQVRFDIHYKYYCRTPMNYCRLELCLPGGHL